MPIDEPTTDGDALRAYVSAPSSDAAFVAECWKRAVALVDEFLGTKKDSIDADVRRGWYLDVGGRLYNRRQAPEGSAQFATPGASPALQARDPLIGIYPEAQRFIGLGIG